MIIARLALLALGVFATPSPRPSLPPSSSDPALTAFEFNAGYGLVTLTFDTIVQSKTFDITKIALQSTQSYSSSSTARYSLNNTYNVMSTQGNSSTMFFYLTSDQHARIQLNNDFATAISDTYIAMEYQTVRSTSNHASQTISSSSAFKCTTYTADVYMPEMKSFSLDMNSQRLSIVYSEPIDVSSFRLKGLQLQVESNVYVTNSLFKAQLVDTDFRVHSVSDLNRTIVVDLGITNFRALTAFGREDLFLKQADSTYLSALTSNVNDTNGNALNFAFSSVINGIAVSDFMEDTTAPTLSSFTLDNNYGTLNLYFSESVDIRYLNSSEIVLTNKRSSALSPNYYRLTSITSPLLSDETAAYADKFNYHISIVFTESQFNLMAADSSLGTASTTYIVLGAGVVQDTALAQNSYLGLDANYTNAMLVAEILPDTTNPTLVAFDLNMDAREIRLNFSKLIKPSSLSVASMTILSEGTLDISTEKVVMSSDYLSLKEYRATTDKVMVLTMTSSLFQLLKAQDSLANSISTSYVSITATFLTDNSGNGIVAVATSNALVATAYTPDRTSPTLESYTFSLDAGKLVLTFNEPIDATQADFTSLSFSSDATSTSATETVSGDSLCYAVSALGVTLTAQLSPAVIDLIKTKATLCSSASRCHLSLASSFITDTATYAASSSAAIRNDLAAAAFVKPTTFTGDLTRPRLESFDINMASKTISLFFNEPIKGSTIDTSSIHIYGNHSFRNATSRASTATLHVQLSVYNFFENVVGSNLTITLTNYDYLRIKSKLSLCSTSSNCFLAVDSDFVTDTRGNSINATLSSRLQPSSYTADTKYPSLLAVAYNSTQSNVTLYFDDVIPADSVNLQSVYMANAIGSKIVLDKATITSTGYTTEVFIDAANVAASLAAASIGTTQDNTKIYISANDAWYDVAINKGVKMAATSNAIRAGNSIVSFSFDVESGTVTLESAVKLTDNIQSFAPGSLTFGSSDTSTTYSLTGYSSYSVDLDYFLNIVLTSTDLREIKDSFSLLRNRLFLKIARTAILDKHGSLLSAAQTLSASRLELPSAPPTLTSWTLDLGGGTVVLYFSSTVSVADAAVGLLSIQSSRTSANVSVDLSDAVVTTSVAASTSLTIDINAGVYPSAKDRIHASGSIAKALSSTYLSVGSGFVKDTEMSPTYMLEIESVNATQASQLTGDLVAPELSTYRIDLDTLTMTLVFTEAVNTSLVDTGMFVLGRDPDKETADTKYRLSSSVLDTDASVGGTVVVSISAGDYRSMMLLAPQLCLTKATCHLSIKAGAVYDLSYKKVTNDELLFRYGAVPNSFIADSTSPTLSSYDFELESGLVSFRFSEVISCTAFDVGKLTLQAGEFIGESSSLKYALSNATADVACPADFFDSLTLTISKDAIISMKATTSLAKTRAATYIIASAGAFRDAYGNANTAVIDGHAIQAANYSGDGTPPRLLSYTVSAAATMTLSFNEPIDISSVDQTLISFQDAYPIHAKIYALSSSSSYTGADAKMMNIQIALSTDYSLIKGDSSIFEAQTTTFLSFLAGMCSDASGNDIGPVATTSAIQIGPTIVWWGLDLDAEVIYLEFSEGVNENFTMAGIGVQSNATTDERGTVILTNSKPPSRTYSSSYAYYYQQLNGRDADALKRSNITRSINTAYLTAPNALTNSRSDATIIAYLDMAEVRVTSALAASLFVPDTSAPLPLRFSLDLSLGVLEVVFDEPIDTSTVTPSGLTLLSYYGSFAQLSAEGTTVSLRNYTHVAINMSTTDLNSIKLAVSTDGVLEYLLIDSGAVRDFYGNSVGTYDEYDPVKLGEYVADSSPPRLQSVEYNAGLGLFTVTFDELVDIDSVRIDKWLLLNISDTSLDSNSNTGDNELFRFSNHSFYEYGDSRNIIEVSLVLYGSDFYRLQEIVAVSSNSSRTFLYVASLADIFGNTLAGDIYHMTIDTDSIRPSLVAMDFFSVSSSSSSYSVTMYFSENIVFKSFNVSAFTFIERKSSNMTANHRKVLSAGSIAIVGAYANLTHSVKFTVPKTQFTGTSIGSAASTYVYISSSSSAPVDRYGNRVTKTSSTTAIRAGPALLRYLLDMDKGRLTVVFSRAVNLFGRFNASSIGFYSPVTKKKMFISVGNNPGGAQDLSPRFVSTANDTVGTMLLSSYDLSVLKLLDVSESSAYLVVRADGMVFDTDNQRLISIDESQTFVPTKFVSDRTAPKLVNLTIDMSLNKIYFHFSEPIRQSSVEVTKFVFQSSSSSSSNSYQLTGGSIAISLDTMILSLAITDSGYLKLQENICKNLSSTYLSFAYQTCADMAGNYLRSAPASNALNFSNFVPDTLGPTLDLFTADMELGRLYLTFSEPVLASSVNFASYNLQNRYFSKDGTNYTLTGGNVTSEDGFTITLQLSDADRDRLKYEIGMYRTRYSAYLTITAAAATDVLGNTVAPILDGAALACSKLIIDSTPPTVLKVVMNVDEYYIDVYMSEWITVDLVDISAFTIQASASSADTTFSLTKGLSRRGSYAHPYTKVLRVEIDDHDMNVLKQRPPLARTKEHTFFAFNIEFAEDVYGNNVEPILSSAALQVDDIAADSITPAVLSYAVDMNENKMSILFDEAVDTGTLDLGQLFLQTSLVKRNGNATSLAGSSVTVTDKETSTVVDIFFSPDISKYMRYSNIGKTYALTKITWLAKFIADFNGQYINPRYDAAVFGYTPLAPVSYTADSTSPSLQAWFFDEDRLALLLDFDEPVRAVNTSQIAVYRYASGDLASTTFLDGAALNVSLAYSNYSSRVHVTIADFCLEYTAKASATECSLLFLDALVNTANQLLYLSLGADSFVDLALAENKISAISLKREGQPECGACSSGYYESTACTSTEDRQCSACRACPNGTFVGEACTSDFDTICQRCSDCSYGQYISTTCTSIADTVCGTCTKCGATEYQYSECVNGENAQCNSCKTCRFTDESSADQCYTKRYMSWARANCCTDSKGELVACSEKDLKDLYYSAVSGEHYLPPFEVTSPKKTSS